jgi:hypothetical protein
LIDCHIPPLAGFDEPLDQLIVLILVCNAATLTAIRTDAARYLAGDRIELHFLTQDSFKLILPTM